MKLFPVIAAAVLAFAAPAGAQQRPAERVQQDIDAVDQSLLALLNQRAALSQEAMAAAAGEGGPAFRPGAQAARLRRLAAVNRGPLPNQAVFRIWQEVMGETIRQIGPFTVAFAGPETVASPLAVDYFGRSPTLVRAGTSATLRGLIATGQAHVGVITLDTGERGTPWWRTLAERGDAPAFQVVARLPLVTPSPGHVKAPGFVVATYGADASGWDKALLVVDGAAGTTATAVADALGFLGWRRVAVLADAEADPGHSWLVEADAPNEDPRGIEPGKGPLSRIVRIGRYAEPLAANF
ncbi:MAG TPA: chorismate mutase [Azospirillum sp.]|nr:chorismate mutase [Azospirillum sp.]